MTLDREARERQRVGECNNEGREREHKRVMETIVKEGGEVQSALKSKK
jgi:hypothetical protein